MDWSGIFSDATRTGLGINAAVYALAAVGLNLQYGYTGLWNFGQAGFLLRGGWRRRGSQGYSLGAVGSGFVRLPKRRPAVCAHCWSNIVVRSSIGWTVSTSTRVPTIISTGSSW